MAAEHRQTNESSGWAVCSLEVDGSGIWRSVRSGWESVCGDSSVLLSVNVVLVLRQISLIIMLFLYLSLSSIIVSEYHNKPYYEAQPQAYKCNNTCYLLQYILNSNEVYYLSIEYLLLIIIIYNYYSFKIIIEYLIFILIIYLKFNLY